MQTSVAVFRRVFVFSDERTPTSISSDAEIGRGMVEFPHKLGHYCYTSLNHIIRKSRQPCLFTAADGMAIAPTTADRGFRAAYVIEGLTDAFQNRKAIGHMRRTHDVDFDGTLERVRGADGRVRITFHGRQSDAFEQLTELAILVPLDACPGLSRSTPIVFEAPQRSKVTTVLRHPVQKFTADKMTNATAIGEGFLMWHPSERQTDRYGTVRLKHDLTENGEKVTLATSHVVGKAGTLVAEILNSRPIEGLTGDVFRRFFGEPVSDGELFCLGKGKIIADGTVEIGCQPSDGREFDWLNPRALYMCSCQYVRLHVLSE